MAQLPNFNKKHNSNHLNHFFIPLAIEFKLFTIVICLITAT